MSKVSVNLVTWNGKRFLEHLLPSLAEQTFQDFEVLVIDNASNDGTVKWLKEKYPKIRVIENPRNKGFAHAHNQAIHFTGGEYVLMLNQDMILTKTYLEEVVAALGAKPEAASACGILLSLSGQPDSLTKDSFTTTIDTAGLKVFKSRRVVDAYAGKDISTYPHKDTHEVFGVSGALPLYRRAALDDVMVSGFRTKNGSKGGEYFDEDFDTYKEDIDLAWRLKLRGWSSVVVPSAKAYHFRSAAGNEVQGNIATLKNRLGKSEVSKMGSLRNHLWMLVKNDQYGNILRSLPLILWYEMRKWGIVLLFEQKSLKALWQFFTCLPKMLKKRKVIQERIKVRPQEIRHWFN